MPAKEIEGKCEINKILNSSFPTNIECNSNKVKYNISRNEKHLGRVCADCVILTYDLDRMTNSYIEWQE